MPTYDYECDKCGLVFEVFHSMTETPKVKCEKPRCKGKPRKLIGAGAGIIFKGSGFYETDYKKKTGSPDKDESKTSDSKSDSKSPESKDGSGSKSKTETKSESKSESGSSKKSKAESKTSSNSSKGNR